MDRNGKVDTKEMEKIIEAIYDLLGEEHRKGENSPSERVKVIMHKLDKDGNGYLSEDGNIFLIKILIRKMFQFFIFQNLSMVVWRTQYFVHY